MTDTLLQFDLVPLTDSMLSGMYSLTNWMEPLFAAKPTMIEKWSGYFYNAILVVLGIGFVIFVHELGHFLALVCNAISSTLASIRQSKSGQFDCRRNCSIFNGEKRSTVLVSFR